MGELLLSHFRKAPNGFWVCRFPLRLLVGEGRYISFRQGQALAAGDYTYNGQDLAGELERLSSIAEAPAPSALKHRFQLEVPPQSAAQTETVRLKRFG